MKHWSPLLQLVQRHSGQGFIGGEMMATCVNLTESGIELSIMQQKVGTSTT